MGSIFLFHTCDSTHAHHMCDVTHVFRIQLCDVAETNVPLIKRLFLVCAFDGFFFSSLTCLIHTCAMTNSYVRHDVFIRATWLIHTIYKVVLRVCFCLVNFQIVCASWGIHVSGATHSFARAIWPTFKKLTAKQCILTPCNHMCAT